MSTLTKLTATETKIFVREPLAVFWGLVFPTLLLLVLGFVFPGGRTPSDDLGGYRLVDIYAPVIIALALATLAFATLPAILANYRERGVLRRLFTTPVGPWRLVVAQLQVQVLVAVVSTALALVVGAAVFDIVLPQNLIGFVLVFLLAAASMLSIGLLIGAVAPTMSSGQGIGMAVYFPMLFFAGVYFPRAAMPDGLRAISDLTPSGAAVQAIGDVWGGMTPPLSSLIVMTAFAVGAGLLAVLLFRWE